MKRRMNPSLQGRSEAGGHPPHPPPPPVAAPGHHCTADERFRWAADFCARIGLRLTSVRRDVLKLFAGERTPINLDSVAHSDALRGRCDATTVYRTLMLLCEAGVLRQVSLRSKSRFFALNMPGELHDHLVCRRCGTVVCLPGSDTLERIARELESLHRFASVRHDLEFHGLCPACQQATRNDPPVSKLPRRLPRETKTS
jgi:Fur family ferric uptake transcriptional regulator